MLLREELFKTPLNMMVLKWAKVKPCFHFGYYLKYELYDYLHGGTHTFYL